MVRRESATKAGSSRRRSLGRKAAIGLSTLCLVVGCSTPPAPRPVEARPVKTMVVTAGDELRTRSFPGTVEASRRVELTFQVPGLLVKLPVREGQQVAKGGVIAELRQDEFRARLEALRGQLGRPRRGHPGCGGRGARARGPRGRSEPSARGHDAPCAIRRYHRGGRLRTSSRRCGFGAGSSAGGRRCGASGTWSPRRATCAASSRSGSRRHDAIARRFPLPSLQCRARTSCAAPALLAAGYEPGTWVTL